jgi:hypothetical protein
MPKVAEAPKVAPLPLWIPNGPIPVELIVHRRYWQIKIWRN